MESYAQTTPIKAAKAKYLKHTGFELELDMANARKFSLQELQGFVGGFIEVITLPDGRELVINEEGRNKNLPVNIAATTVWLEAFPLDKFPNNNPADVRGHALLLENYLWPDK